MADLITQAWLNGALADAALTANQQALLPQLTAAASRLIRRWCNRQFTRATYDELYTVDGPRARLLLREYPVNAVSRIATDPTTVITIQNTDATTNQRALASLATTGNVDTGQAVTGLTLTRVASGTTTSTTIAWTGLVPPTVQALATAIAAVGAGWTATADPQHALWPVADLRQVQGVLPALSPAQAELVIHTSDVPFSLDERTGIVDLRAADVEDPFRSFRFGPYLSTSLGDLDVRGGYLGVRVVYDAGLDTVPEDLQQATVEVVKAMLERLQTDTTLTSETDGAYSWQARELIGALPPWVQQVLALYRSTRL